MSKGTPRKACPVCECENFLPCGKRGLWMSKVEGRRKNLHSRKAMSLCHYHTTLSSGGGNVAWEGEVLFTLSGTHL